MSYIDRNTLLEDGNKFTVPDGFTKVSSVITQDNIIDFGPNGRQLNAGSPVYLNAIIKLGKAAGTTANDQTFKFILATGFTKPANTSPKNRSGVFSHYESDNVLDAYDATKPLAPYKAYDITLKQADFAFNNVPANVYGDPGGGYLSRQIGSGPDWVYPGHGGSAPYDGTPTLGRYVAALLRVTGTKPRWEFDAWLDTSPLTDPKEISNIVGTEDHATWRKSGNTILTANV